MAANRQQIQDQINFNKELEKQRQIELDIQSSEELRGVIIANIAEATGKSNTVKRDALKSSRQLQSISETLLQDTREESVLSEKELEKLIVKTDLARQNLALDIASQDLTDQQRNNFQDILDKSIELVERSKERLQLEKDITTAGGLAGGIAGSLQASLDKIGANKLAKSLGIDDALAKNKLFTKDLIQGGAKAGDLGTKFKAAGNLVGNLGKNLAKSLGPIALIAELVNGIKAADEETTELGKSMAMTKGESALFRENLAEAARDSGNMAVTGTKMVENFNSLNKQLGFINNYTLDTLVTMTKLTEQVGLSKEEAGSLVTLSEARGKNAEDEYKSALSTSYQLQRQSGIQLDLREILKDIGKISGQLRANLGANPKAMAEAVTLAKQLGGSLDDIKSISSSILDFEGSIAKELEAELLTGKEINLERARLAALNGDIADLTREITSQVGSFTEFSKMNVIQQEALATAFGLSSDKLSDMLFKQQLMGRSAKELRAAGEDDLARMVEQQSMQDKFNQTVEKLKAVFTDVGTAIMPVFEVLGFALSIVGAIVALVTDLLSMLKGDFDFSATAASLGTFGSQLGIGGGGGGSGYNSGGDRPGNSRSSSSDSEGKRTNDILEKGFNKLYEKNANLYMNDQKLNSAINTGTMSWAIGS